MNPDFSIDDVGAEFNIEDVDMSAVGRLNQEANMIEDDFFDESYTLEDYLFEADDMTADDLFVDYTYVAEAGPSNSSSSVLFRRDSECAPFIPVGLHPLVTGPPKPSSKELAAAMIEKLDRSDPTWRDEPKTPGTILPPPCGGMPRPRAPQGNPFPAKTIPKQKNTPLTNTFTGQTMPVTESSSVEYRPVLKGPTVNDISRITHAPGASESTVIPVIGRVVSPLKAMPKQKPKPVPKTSTVESPTINNSTSNDAPFVSESVITPAAFSTIATDSAMTDCLTTVPMPENMEVSLSFPYTDGVPIDPVLLAEDAARFSTLASSFDRSGQAALGSTSFTSDSPAPPAAIATASIVTPLPEKAAATVASTQSGPSTTPTVTPQLRGTTNPSAGSVQSSTTTRPSPPTPGAIGPKSFTLNAVATFNPSILLANGSAAPPLGSVHSFATETPSPVGPTRHTLSTMAPSTIAGSSTVYTAAPSAQHIRGSPGTHRYGSAPKRAKGPTGAAIIPYSAPPSSSLIKAPLPLGTDRPVTAAPIPAGLPMTVTADSEFESKMESTGLALIPSSVPIPYGASDVFFTLEKQSPLPLWETVAAPFDKERLGFSPLPVPKPNRTRPLEPLPPTSEGTTKLPPFDWKIPATASPRGYDPSKVIPVLSPESSILLRKSTNSAETPSKEPKPTSPFQGPSASSVDSPHTPFNARVQSTNATGTIRVPRPLSPVPWPPDEQLEQLARFNEALEARQQKDLAEGNTTSYLDQLFEVTQSFQTPLEAIVPLNFTAESTQLLPTPSASQPASPFPDPFAVNANTYQKVIPASNFVEGTPQGFHTTPHSVHPFSTQITTSTSTSQPPSRAAVPFIPVASTTSQSASSFQEQFASMARAHRNATTPMPAQRPPPMVSESIPMEITQVENLLSINNSRVMDYKQDSPLPPSNITDDMDYEPGNPLPFSAIAKSTLLTATMTDITFPFATTTDSNMPSATPSNGSVSTWAAAIGPIPNLTIDTTPRKFVMVEFSPASSGSSAGPTSVVSIPSSPTLLTNPEVSQDLSSLFTSCMPKTLAANMAQKSKTSQIRMKDEENEFAFLARCNVNSFEEQPRQVIEILHAKVLQYKKEIEGHQNEIKAMRLSQTEDGNRIARIESEVIDLRVENTTLREAGKTAYERSQEQELKVHRLSVDVESAKIHMADDANTIAVQKDKLNQQQNQLIVMAAESQVVNDHVVLLNGQLNEMGERLKLYQKRYEVMESREKSLMKDNEVFMQAMRDRKMEADDAKEKYALLAMQERWRELNDTKVQHAEKSYNSHHEGRSRMSDSQRTHRAIPLKDYLKMNRGQHITPNVGPNALTEVSQDAPVTTPSIQKPRRTQLYSSKPMIRVPPPRQQLSASKPITTISLAPVAAEPKIVKEHVKEHVQVEEYVTSYNISIAPFTLAGYCIPVFGLNLFIAAIFILFVALIGSCLFDYHYLSSFRAAYLEGNELTRLLTESALKNRGVVGLRGLDYWLGILGGERRLDRVSWFVESTLGFNRGMMG